MKLATYLRRQKLSQADFAREAGVPASQVSLWLRGKRGPSVESARRVYAATKGAVTLTDWQPASADR